jgi:hypothetical protein
MNMYHVGGEACGPRALNLQHRETIEVWLKAIRIERLSHFWINMPTGSKRAEFYGKHSALGHLPVRIRANTAILP